MIGDLAWEPDIDDRSRKIVPRYHNVEGPPERVSWPDHRLVKPERIQNAVEFDGVGVMRIVQMYVYVTGDEYWAAVDDEKLEHGCELVEELSGDRSGSVDGQRHDV